MVQLKVVRKYRDVEKENQLMSLGELVEVTHQRAEVLLKLGLVEIVRIAKITKGKK